MTPTAIVSRRGADRIRAGHPWIYRSDVTRADAEPGDLVRVVEDRSRGAGWAMFSSLSQITLRMVSRSTAPVDERELWRARLAAAADYRDGLGIDGSAWRVVNGEADRLPATVVDRYAEGADLYLVVQTLAQGSDRRRDLLVELLVERLAPRGILARNDPKVRQLEGLEPDVSVLYG